MRPCSNCIFLGIVCVAHRSSNKCASCVSLAKTCDLVVSVEDWNKLDAEREQIRNEIDKHRRLVSDSLAELSRLEKLQDSLRKGASSMIAREDQNLKEMEEDASNISVSASATEPINPELSAWFG